MIRNESLCTICFNFESLPNICNLYYPRCSFSPSQQQQKYLDSEMGFIEWIISPTFGLDLAGLILQETIRRSRYRAPTPRIRLGPFAMSPPLRRLIWTDLDIFLCLVFLCLLPRCQISICISTLEFSTLCPIFPY